MSDSGPVSPVSPVTVRAARPGESAAALDVWRHAHVVRRNGRPVPQGHSDTALARMARPGALLLVAEDDADGRIVGTVLGQQGLADDGAGPPVPGLMHVSLLSVAPDAWGRRIGRHLMNGVARLAEEQGYDSIQLWTHADNLRANRLYKSLGYRRSGRARIDDWGELLVHYKRVTTP